MAKSIFIFVSSIYYFSPAFSQRDIGQETYLFLKEYNETYTRLSTALSNAEWKSNTRIVEGDTATSGETERAGTKFAEFTGSTWAIEGAKMYLFYEGETDPSGIPWLDPVMVRQLEAILFLAANNPGTVQDLVEQRIKAETKQTEALYGYSFMLDGREITPNDMDSILNSSANLDERRKVWETSKEVGTGLKTGLENLRNLRNGTVKALGYDDYFAYQISDYDMTVEEMRSMLQSLIRDVWPLYREMHTWARYELAEKFGEKVPEYLPAHWLSNRWGQDWAEMVSIEGVNLDSVLKSKGSPWLIEQAERFYVSMGFPALPKSFWEKSSLYPAPDTANWKKNNHASAWHMDLEQDVRCLQSLVPNANWYETTHHELGHIYYYLAYSNPDVPMVLRGGANRAWHEGFGSLLGLAAMQKPFLENLDLIPKGVKSDETQILLKEALNYIVFIPWSAGVMTEFEHSLYSKELPADQFNSRWWELAKKYQGIVPPEERDEKYCDACSKTHINNDAAQYYDYALSFVYLFQWHDYISRELLNQDPHSTNYFGRREAGKFLTAMMTPGATADWQELMYNIMGAGLSAKPMLEYFSPLLDYLREENKGREHTLPEVLE